MRRAIVFWACHDKYFFDMARYCARTVKKQMKDVDTVLLTDHQEWKRKPFDQVVVVPKVSPIDVCFCPLHLLPEGYDSAIYVGAKVIFVAPVYDAFELVEDARTDIALPLTSGKRRDAMYPAPGIPEAFPHFRSAFIAFQDHERMRNFFLSWRDEFEKERAAYTRPHRRDRHTDQSPLRKALYRSDLSIAVLRTNFLSTLGDEIVQGTVRTVSFRGDWDLKKLAAEANRHAPHLRLFVRGESVRL